MKSIERPSRDVNGIATAFMRRLASVLEDLIAEHSNPYVFECRRSYERQKWLYASGRSREGSILTGCDGRVKVSRHQSGMAADIIFRSESESKPFWPRKGHPKWALLGKSADLHGLRWGGDWGDYCHVELVDE